VKFLEAFGLNKSKKSSEATKMSGGQQPPDNLVVGAPSGLGDIGFADDGPNLAELVCYYHKNGTSVSEIASMTKMKLSAIETLVNEAKEAGLYEVLAGKLK
jgi:hypothetical protein